MIDTTDAAELARQAQVTTGLNKAGLADGAGICTTCHHDVFTTAGTDRCDHVHRQAQGIEPQPRQQAVTGPDTVPYPTTPRGGNGTERSEEPPDTVPDDSGNDPERYGTDGSPLWFDVAGMLEHGIPEPPTPTICRRKDGVGLFYAGQVCNLFGDPESGKTWVTLAATTETLNSGGTAAYLDLDHNGPEQIISRLVQLGADPAALRDPRRFRYVEPEDRQHLMSVVASYRKWRPKFAVIDSVGELLPCLGLKSGDPDDFTVANTAVMKPLATSGACVVTIDHLAQNSESRTLGPTGTLAKKRAIGGTMLRVVVDDQFTPGAGGTAHLYITKDRPGGLKRYCPQAKGEAHAGMFKLTEDDDGLHWVVLSPQDAPAPPASEGPGSKGGMTEEEAVAILKALPEGERPTTNESARRLLGCRNTVASAAMRILRSEAQKATVPDSHPYVGNGTERSCQVCGEPLISSDPNVTIHPNCEPQEAAS